MLQNFFQNMEYGKNSHGILDDWQKSALNMDCHPNLPKKKSMNWFLKKIYLQYTAAGCKGGIKSEDTGEFSGSKKYSKNLS